MTLFKHLITDEVSDMTVRANADTPQDALTARNLMLRELACRTEHMFFESDRLTVMREMIFSEFRGSAVSLGKIKLPMQRKDFIELFET